MAASTQLQQGSTVRRRRSILDLAPLELECMNVIWPVGEATVREVQQALAPNRPRAYTTIMTILDRLAHKGVVVRRKSGRAYVYSASLTAHDARETAVDRLVASFFAGSRSELVRHLGYVPVDMPHAALPPHTEEEPALRSPSEPSVAEGAPASAPANAPLNVRAASGGDGRR